MEKKKLPIGLEDFAEVITQDYYYVDKTGMIKELLNNRGKVNLFTRPRCFGKSINMSMLKCFFEIGTDKSLFNGLAISKETELCEKYMGQYPVISINFKNVKGVSYNEARSSVVNIINEEAEKFNLCLNSTTLSSIEKESLSLLMDKDMKDYILISSLKDFTELLEKYYGKKVVVLIDEYDVPLKKAYECGYYDKMVELIHGMFHQALKTNSSLKFAVLAGCLHVSKESIISGFNNAKVYSLLEAECDEQFGFTDDEVREMLEYYGLSEYYEITNEWYGGYNIGRASVYSPWDVINWCNQLLTNPNDKVPKNYWTDLGSNLEVQRFIQELDAGVSKLQIRKLVSGKSVQKKIEEQITYDSMYDSVENMWSLLYATGYLTQSETPSGDWVRLNIPNAEICSLFQRLCPRIA